MPGIMSLFNRITFSRRSGKQIVIKEHWCGFECAAGQV